MKKSILKTKFNPNLLNIIIISYLSAVYLTGVALLFGSYWQLNILGVFLVAHSLMLSATLLHELLHDNIFKQRSRNQLLGKIMTHLNGSCYAPYSELVQHHLNHHIYHFDIVPFDITGFFTGLPKLIRYLFIALEWLYFPLFEFIMRWRLIITPFTNPDKYYLRQRTLIIFLYRFTIAVIIGVISGRALLFYFVAYTCFVNLMRFIDAFHHTYEYVIAGEQLNNKNKENRDRIYEQAHTFSNLVSEKYPWLNLLYLNFGYHNAHHHDMRCPWYRLPQLHQSLYGKEAKNLLPLPQLIGNYHRFRILRLLRDQGDVKTADSHDTLASFTGAIGVSLLTPP